MDELVIDNVNLIYHTLKKLNMYHLLEEYYDVGMIGLVKASKKYTEEKGKFSTYACTCIANEILLEVRKQKSGKRNAEVISINKVIYSDDSGSITIEDTISSNECIEEKIIEEEQYRIMYKLIDELKASDKELIKNYYGIGREKMTQLELAKCMKQSQAQISRRIEKLIKEMRSKVR